MSPHTEDEKMNCGCEATLPLQLWHFQKPLLPFPSLAHPAGPTYPPAESSLSPAVGPAVGVKDFLEPTGTASVPLDSEPATETLDLVQQPEDPDDPQQLPRQIHIQQHLKLHFHNQGELCNDADPHIS